MFTSILYRTQPLFRRCNNAHIYPPYLCRRFNRRKRTLRLSRLSSIPRRPNSTRAVALRSRCATSSKRIRRYWRKTKSACATGKRSSANYLYITSGKQNTPFSFFTPTHNTAVLPNYLSLFFPNCSPPPPPPHFLLGGKRGGNIRKSQ